MPVHPNAKRLPTGVRVRHTRKCASKAGAACNCKPSYEAAVFLARDGKKLRRTFTSLSEARRWRHDAASAAGKGQLRAPTGLTLTQAAEQWLEGARSGAIRNRSGDAYKASAWRGYELALRLRVLPDLGARRLADITRPDLQALVGRAQATGLSPSSIRNTLLPLRAIYRHWGDDVPVNPTVGVRLPAVRGKRDRIASPTEAQALLAVLAPADRVLFAVAMFAGLRLGELRALRWQDVDLGAGVIRVEQGWDALEGVIAPKSAAGTRRVPVVAALRELLIEHRLSTGGEGLVFGCGERAFSPNSVRKRARSAWAAAGLEAIGLHDCRHTFASLMIAAGVNAKALSMYLGHSAISITFDRYGHLMPGNEAEAADLLDAYLQRADTAARLAQLEAV
jgi:integrase